MRYIHYLLLSFILSCNTKDSCNQLKEGTFSLYENDKLVGQLYRKDNIQIEKYSDKEPYTIGKLKYINDCELQMRHYYVKESIDTITWLVSYIPLAKNTFKVNAKPAYIDTLNYSYMAKMVKTDKNLPIELHELFKKLNQSK